MGIGQVNTTTRDTMTPSATFFTAKVNNTNPSLDYAACNAVTAASAMAPSDAAMMYPLLDKTCSSRYCHIMPPNSANCATGNTTDDGVAHTASSRHAAGVNALLMDGSVKFMKSSIANNVWWALGSMSGGEPISAGSF